ncbi:MAG: DNA-directed RNA polymerase subunit K [Candidatus Diapherotrites archaeon]|uniref:DNA-directed RNA polymerase subunit K n=1 Tax=Candidatus Iainarchaeum sp. TaxID=3101447 RepID=A0A8T4L3T3_9ARCH|nr:DNA-directed RNA polymerase subunit K [Candidatus Diapherotrites archaeon]
MDKLTRFEETRLISARALQLALGAPAFVKPGNVVSVIDVAEKELHQKTIPLTVSHRRYVESELEAEGE